jgi:hypothetical protein
MRITAPIMFKSLAVALIAGATLVQTVSGAEARDRIVPRMLDHVMPTAPGLEPGLPVPSMRRLRVPKLPSAAAGIAEATLIAAQDEECGEYLARWLITRKSYWRGRYDACRLD